MSAASTASGSGAVQAALLPLLDGSAPTRAIVFDGERRTSAARFVVEVRAVAATLPEAPLALNLCEDRHAFLVAFCAVALRGQTTLLPHSRAPGVVAEMLARHPDAYCLGDAAPPRQPPRFHCLPPLGASLPPLEGAMPQLAAVHPVAIGFTSGSTGQPKAHPKTWGAFAGSNACNATVLRQLAGGRADIVATVPSQHMYGMELTVLLPLLGDFAVHAGRPLYPADVAAALHVACAPRLLVTTPVHLRVLVDSGVALPPLAGIVTATAPLSRELALRAESVCGAPVQELFGSTETCVIAHRRTARDDDWTLYPGVELAPQPGGTLVRAPWHETALPLQDVVELLPPSADGVARFALRGRSADLVEIAGKRASLGELTQRLLALPGVRDGLVFQSAQADAAGVRRIVAVAVAPGADAATLLAQLRQTVDPVFLPRPLRLVEALPRNETGKLTRTALDALLQD